jgi:hypothetical protein
MEAIGYTVAPGDSLTLQITSSAANRENFTSLRRRDHLRHQGRTADSRRD